MAVRRSDEGRGVEGAALGEGANLDDQIYERLKAMIVDGALLSGERIVPERLAGEMGVSRTPMLAALKRLSQERLVEWRSRRGVFVRRFTKRELALIFEVREVLEGLAARRAAAVITPAQVGHFRSLFRSFESGVEETPEIRRSYLRQDYLFHSGILELAGSQPLSETSRSVNIMVSAFGAGLLRPIAHVLPEHEAIYEALERRDPDAAEKAMRSHIRPSVEWLHREADVAEAVRSASVDFHPQQPIRRGVRSHEQ